MDPLGFLFGAFAGSFLVLFTEELVDNAAYSLPTLAVSYCVGLLAYSAIHLHANRVVTWCLVGAVTALVASVVRVGLPYGGYVSMLAGVDCFDMLNLTNATYVLFALSGCVVGAFVALKGDPGIKHAGILGIGLGVLYQLKIATDWWTSEFPTSFLLFLGEFLAPVLFVYLCSLWARSLAYVYRKGQEA